VRYITVSRYITIVIDTNPNGKICDTRESMEIDVDDINKMMLIHIR
jgi:hypothetical protein